MFCNNKMIISWKEFDAVNWILTNLMQLITQTILLHRIEAFGGPKEVGEALMRSVAGGSRRTDINATLIDSTMRTDPLQDVNYYLLEFRVDSPSFHRHNVAVCTARRGRLFTLNAQAPESAWPDIREEFYEMSNSFSLVSSAWERMREKKLLL